MISINVTSEQVAGAVFRPGGKGRLVLRSFAVERFSAAATEGDWASRAGEALRTVAVKLQARGEVRLAIPDRVALTKFIRVPSISGKKRAGVIEFEAMQAIPFPPAEVVWDYTVINDDGKNLDVMLTVTKRALVESLCAAAAEAGLSLGRVVPASQALRTALQAGERPNFIVDVHADSTALVLAGQRMFRLRNLPGAGAELDRLQQEIGRFLAHVGRESGVETPRTAFLSGPAARSGDLEVELGKRLGVPVRRIEPLKDCLLVAKRSRTEREVEWDLLPPLIGLARERSDSPGLLPPLAKDEWRWRRRQPVIVAMAALITLALLPPLAYLREANRVLATKVSETEGRLSRVKTAERTAAATRAKLAETCQQVELWQRLGDARTTWLEFFADLQDRLGDIEDVWIEQMVLDPLTATGRTKNAPTPGMQFSLTGRLLDVENPTANVSAESIEKVHRLFASLAQSPFISRIQGERFDNSQPGLLRFDVTLVCDPKRPL